MPENPRTSPAPRRVRWHRSRRYNRNLRHGCRRRGCWSADSKYRRSGHHPPRRIPRGPARAKGVGARDVARQRVGFAGPEDRFDHAPNGFIVGLHSRADGDGRSHCRVQFILFCPDMSALGQKRTNSRRRKSTFVRCYSNSGQTRAQVDCPLSATLDQCTAAISTLIRSPWWRRSASPVGRLGRVPWRSLD